MKNYLIGAGAAIVLVAIGFLGGHATVSTQTLGSYTPSNPISASGYAAVYNTTVTLPANAFCGGTPNTQWINQTTTITATTQTAASSSAGCVNQNPGASYTGMIVNDGTSTITYAAASGVSLLCETIGAGTSTVQGSCTASSVTILSASAVQWTSFFDPTNANVKILIGNNFH